MDAVLTPQTIVSFDLSTFVILLFVVINVVVLGPIAWILRSAISDLKRIEIRQENFEREVISNYVKHEHHENNMAEIKSLLREIFNKLDGKQDKSNQ